MIAVTGFKGKKLALFGLGGSGLATAKACLAGGADIIVWDDNAEAVERARAAGLQARDLREIEWGGIAALILSPGVPLTHPKPHWSAVLAHKAGVEIIGDIELFARERRAFLMQAGLAGGGLHNKDSENFCPFIAITGTNGKSTTTALIAHILRQAGFDVQMGGNIGRSVLELDSFKPSARQAYVVECSSYQIDLAPSLNPTIGILLNITPDHIDRHGSFENYAAIKERLAAQSRQAVIAYDDAPCRAVYDRLEKAGKKPIGIIIGETGLYKKNGRTQDKTEADFLQNAPALRGRHNAQNAGAAFFACRALGVDKKQIMAAMRDFRGLPHRMEEVGYLRLSDGEIEFINDSKATNAEAAAPALQSFENIYWIAGGIAKQGGIESLTEYLPHVRKTYLIGEATEDFAKVLDKAGAACILSRNLEKAVKQAVADAKKDLQEGDRALRRAVILLAPACASFDQFKNFEERGKAFAALAERAIKETEEQNG